MHDLPFADRVSKETVQLRSKANHLSYSAGVS
jgi:hypothetical protein